MQEFAYTLGNVVKQARLGQKLTQLEVAERIQADERTILNIEHYKGNPLIRALGIDANAVFYPEKAHENGDLHRLQLLLDECSTEELSLLLSVCESVLGAFRSAQGKTLSDQ